MNIILSKIKIKKTKQFKIHSHNIIQFKIAFNNKTKIKLKINKIQFKLIINKIKLMEVGKVGIVLIIKAIEFYKINNNKKIFKTF